MDARGTNTPARADSESSRGGIYLHREASRGGTPVPGLSRTKSPEFKLIPRISSALSVSGQSQLHACRWSWCRFTFNDNADLVHHVVQDHVRQAVAVRRRDISIIKMAEEGVGQSLSMSGIFVSDSSQNDGPSPPKRRKTDDDAADVEPTPSLSSPPISSLTSLPTATLEHQGQIVAKTPISVDGHDLQQRQTFASLGNSSSLEDPFEDDFHEPPTLDSMLNSAIGHRQGQTSVASTYSLPAAQQFPTSSAQDRISPSSSFGSQTSVEQQLTQSMDVDLIDAPEDPKCTPSKPGSHLHSVAFNGMLGNRTPAHVTPGLVRQAWYTNQSSHSKRYIPHSQSSSSNSPSTESSQSYGQESRTEALAQPVYSGSGTMQYSPSSAGQLYKQSQVHSTAFSQSELQDSETQLSYPPQLQTQAPYQSQSFTQTQ